MGTVMFHRKYDVAEITLNKGMREIARVVLIFWFIVKIGDQHELATFAADEN